MRAPLCAIASGFRRRGYGVVAAGAELFDSLVPDDESPLLAEPEVEAAAAELLSLLDDSDLALSDEPASDFAGSDSLLVELVPFL